MGMYDHVGFDCELPDNAHEICGNKDWQTKDFSCVMEEIRIENGRLVHDQWHGEEVPAKDRPYPDAEPRTIRAFAGSIRTVIDEKSVDMNHHGFFNFYTIGPKPDEEWFEYNAKFTDGNLVSIERVLDRQAAHDG